MLKIAVTILHVIISLLLITVILLQSGKSAGLSGAISGGAETFFGKKKGLDDLFARYTVYIAIAFGIVSMILVVWK